MLKLADKPSCLGGDESSIKQNSELVFFAQLHRGGSNPSPTAHYIDHWLPVIISRKEPPHYVGGFFAV